MGQVESKKTPRSKAIGELPKSTSASDMENDSENELGLSISNLRLKSSGQSVDVRTVRKRPIKPNSVFDGFAKDLLALRKSYELSSRAVDTATGKELKDLRVALNRFDVTKESNTTHQKGAHSAKSHGSDESKKRELHIPREDLDEFAEQLTSCVNHLKAGLVLRRSLLLAAISQFDAFLARLLTYILSERTELMKASGRTLDFAEISEYGSLDALKTAVVQKEVENVIRESHAKQFDWMESRFNVPLREGLDIWPSFVEITERRNLFAHTDGHVSSQYMSVCKSHGVILPKELAIGAALEIDDEYFFKSISVLHEISLKLTQVLWRKLFPHEIDLADDDLSKSTFTLICSKQYELAIKILDTFLFKTKKALASDRTRRVALVNLAQCYKWLGSNDDCNKVIASEDWSACSKDFELAVCVLKNEFHEASEIMQSLGPAGLSKDAYANWPLFKEFRESDEFLKCYETVYREPFRKVQEKEIKRLNDMLANPQELAIADVGEDRSRKALARSKNDNRPRGRSTPVAKQRPK